VLGMPKRLIKHDLRDAQLMDVGINADRILQAAKEMLRTSGLGRKR
jgi:hypothetical protein